MESGCGHVIEGGQTMNPSVQQIMQGVERAGAEHTIFLPNNKNIVLTAQQVAANDPTVHVVPTRSVPQGVAALLAYNPVSTMEENLAAMEEALPEISTIEITQAVRDTTVDGVTVSLGDYIALLDDKLVITAESAEAALERTIGLVGVDSSSILTIYRGADADPDAAEACAESLEAGTNGLQVDRLYGGQPHYHYLASIE
jgi:dihydroxyacetone kinase-like predicted kinase